MMSNREGHSIIMLHVNPIERYMSYDDIISIGSIYNNTLIYTCCQLLLLKLICLPDVSN